MDRQATDPREVVAGMLDDARLLTACADRDMGTLFRLLNHRGVSTRRLAAAAEITQGRLYDYMNGKSRVEKLVLFEQIADALHIPGHLLGLARREWEFAAAGTQTPHVQAASAGGDLDAMSAFRAADRPTLIEPLLPLWPERSPGPRPVSDRLCLQGILFVLHNDIAWQLLPAELGFGSG